MEYMFHHFSGCQDAERDSERKKTTKKQTQIVNDIARDRRGGWATFKILTSSGLQTDCSTDRRVVEEIYT